jgi:hypothetical protein
MIFFSAVSYILLVQGNGKYTFMYLFIIRMALGPAIVGSWMICEKIISPDIRTTIVSIVIFVTCVATLVNSYIGAYGPYI